MPKPGPKVFAAAPKWEQWSSVGQARSAVSAWGLKAASMSLVHSCCGTQCWHGFSVGAGEEQSWDAMVLPPGQTCLVLLPVCAKPGRCACIWRH